MDRRRKNDPSSSRSLVMSEPVVPGVKLMRGYRPPVFEVDHASRYRSARIFVAGLPASRRTELRFRMSLPYCASISDDKRKRPNLNEFCHPAVNVGFGSPMIVR